MGHTYSSLLMHVVFSTKGRRPLILPEFRARLWEYMGGIARREFGSSLIVGGTDDHLHGLLSLNADVSCAAAMAKWKSLSSGWVHKTFPDQHEFAWQAGYAAFSVSKSVVPAVIRYIEKQEEHHRRVSFQEELVELLKRAGVEFDPARLWD